MSARLADVFCFGTCLILQSMSPLQDVICPKFKEDMLTNSTGKKVTHGSRNSKMTSAPNAKRSTGTWFIFHLTPILKATSISNSNGFLVVRMLSRVSMDATLAVGKSLHSQLLTPSTVACSPEPKPFRPHNQTRNHLNGISIGAETRSPD